MAYTELTVMCMIRDVKTNRVLVQDRVKSWKGISFPGGYVRAGESIVAATIREVKEETGLDISDLRPCGIIHWYNDQTGDRYFVFNFKTDKWSGELLSETDEGKVFWVDIDELPGMKNLSEGFRERLPMFLEEKYIEGFGIWNENRRSEMKFLK